MKKVALVLLVTGLIAGGIWANRDSIGLSFVDADQGGNQSETIDLAAPDVVLPSLDGDWLKLSKYKGQVVLVNFWATWCGYCREETATLIQLQQDYGPKGFTVLGIAVDDEGEESVKTFVETERFDVNGVSTRVNFPMATGYKEVFDKFGGLAGVPSTILISREGREVKRIVGTLRYESTSRAVKKLL